jgi:DNA modification methylase
MDGARSWPGKKPGANRRAMGTVQLTENCGPSTLGRATDKLVETPLSPESSTRLHRTHFRFVAVANLKPSPRNPRKHSAKQIQAIARSIVAFGFNAPILADQRGNVVAGHGRLEAAKLLGLRHVPVIFLDHLTEVQALAYMLADNKLNDRSTWDDQKVATHLKELSEMALDFDIEAIGFELPEIDLHIQSLNLDDLDEADNFEFAAGPTVSLPGDLWLLGRHRLFCGTALDSTSFQALLMGQPAAVCFTDPPYNVKIDGHASGNGQTAHREFAMGTGEMTQPEFIEFLRRSFALICAYCRDGALIYSCMDWRHMSEIVAAGRAANLSLLNLCVWAKTNGGMGSLYRSRHELVFVFKHGQGPHLNNVQLGRFGRNRSNVWNYPGANAFARKGHKRQLNLHPTPKPVALVADAILDCTTRDDIVIDPYVGSGTTILAAERTGRRCHAIEIDPGYVDTVVERWQRMTRQQATHLNGETYAGLKSKRGSAL